MWLLLIHRQRSSVCTEILFFFVFLLSQNPSLAAMKTFQFTTDFLLCCLLLVLLCFVENVCMNVWNFNWQCPMAHMHYLMIRFYSDDHLVYTYLCNSAVAPSNRVFFSLFRHQLRNNYPKNHICCNKENHEKIKNDYVNVFSFLFSAIVWISHVVYSFD